MKPRRAAVLLTCAGRRVELINLFRADAAKLGVDLSVLAADASPGMSPACHAADRAHALPLFSAPEYVDVVLDLCRREGVRLIVPLQDAELGLFAANRERFASAGILCSVSAPAVVELARDKLATARALAAAGIPVPHSAAMTEVMCASEGWAWPLIAKPRAGSASRGVSVVADKSALAQLAATIEPASFLVQEKVEGREYTVNVFFDRAGRVRCAVPHERIEVRAGEVSKGRTERHAVLAAIARQLEVVLPGALGPLCFQAIVPAEGDPKVIEINARFGGGFPLAHRAGATFTRWLLESALGLDESAHDQWAEGVLMLRHDVSVFPEAGGGPRRPG